MPWPLRNSLSISLKETEEPDLLTSKQPASQQQSTQSKQMNNNESPTVPVEEESEETRRQMPVRERFQVETTGNCDTITSVATLLTPAPGGDAIDADSTYISNKQNIYNVDFLTLPPSRDRMRSTTREGTPVSTVTIPVPDAFYQHNLQKRWKRRGEEALVKALSALYAKILVVMGLAFPMSDVISSHVTSSSYLGFYIYLYMGSILYLFYVFLSLVKDRIFSSRAFQMLRRNKEDPAELDSLSERGRSPMRPRAYSMDSSPTHHGSFYLRIGAVAFGVGSMIYSCLEFVQYFEVDSNSKCHDILMAITPAARMLFTFIQMYFIFLNAKMTICHNRVIAHFGLMHMIATNLCVWLNVIIEETKHEILFVHDGHHHGQHGDTHNGGKASRSVSNSSGDVLASALKTSDDLDSTAYLADECRRSEVLGTLVQDASPILFPCAIEYSLICAAILYVMWKNMTFSDGPRSSSASSSNRRSRHHYSVDCARANKGLFAGIFILVFTIISLIMFFALINTPNYKALAIMEVNMASLIVYVLAFIAVIIGMYQVRELRFDSSRAMDLDDVLLVFGQIGVISYNLFTIISAHFSMQDGDTALVLCMAIGSLIQAVTQTLFILDASHRNTYSSEQRRRKPGRQIVTFLLMANFAMWTVNTLEKSRADVNPVQLQFYGSWPWIIITNVSMPLAIFYRFHSTVVLCEIWKRCYKAKNDYSN